MTRSAVSFGVVDAGQFEHPGHVGDVLLAQLGVLVLAVVGFVGQAEAALAEVDDVAVGLLGVGIDVGAESASDAEAGERGQSGE